MIKIRKRSVPAAVEPPKIVGILRTNSSENLKKPRPTVRFVDDIGKQLVDYRYFEAEPKDSNPHHHHEKTSGKMLYHPETKWQLIPVKTGLKPRQKTEMTKREEMRLEQLGISRAPLFGTFETIESLHLIPDAILRAKTPVPRIPMSTTTQNSYSQVFDEPAKSTDVMGLITQLKQRGLIPPGPNLNVEITESPQNQQNQMEKAPRKTRWSQTAQKINKNCIHHTNRVEGCSRGDECRYQHSEEMKAQRQIELLKQQEQQKTDQPWRRSQTPFHHQKRRVPNENRRKSRSRSPFRRRQ